MIDHIVIAPVILPLLSGILLLLIQRQNIYYQRILCSVATLSQLALAIILLQAVSHDDIFVYALGDWTPPFGIVLVADRLAAWMLITTALLACCVLLYAIQGTDTSGAHFHVLFQLQLFGLNGAFLTGDLFNLFVFFEILLLASYSLLLHGGGRLRTKAGLHFVVINLVGSTLFLFAVGTLYGVLGTLNMADLALKVAEVTPENVTLVRTAGLLLFAVFALKAALLPLYLWLPAAYAHTSAPVAALFAIMTKVGAYSILRVYTLIFGAQAGLAANLIESWLLPLALITLILGALGTIASNHLRQQIAYLTITSIGLLLAAFGMNSLAGITAGLYYLPHTTFTTAAFFLLADLIVNRRGKLNDRFHPGPKIEHQRLLGLLFFINAILAAGLPPFSGFIGKLLILNAALSHHAMYWIMGLVLLASLLAVIALARSGSILFYRAAQTGVNNLKTRKFPQIEFAPMVGLLMLCLGLVIYADSVTNFTQATANQLLQPSAYINSVLEQTMTE